MSAASLSRIAPGQGAIAFAAAAAVLLLLVAVLGAGPAENGALLLVGAALGWVLYRASFGFTAAYRAWQQQRRGAGIRAQLLLLALGTALFFPALAAGEVWGRPVWGFVVPAGTAVAAGSALFGLGMQLGGGCGSGTLFALGGGSTRMLLTLAGFIAGSVLGMAQLPFWLALPAPPAISLVAALGWPTALALHFALFGLIWTITVALERRRHGAAAPIARRLVWGAVALAGLEFATLLLAGRPWGITDAFALWGAKILALGGVAAPNIDATPSVLADSTSVMDFGIILGALLAAATAGRFTPGWRIGWRPAAAGVLGGLAMGYGARLASGCNIGAFVGGVLSGSPHGWLWLACALVGSRVGLRLRPRFGL